MPQRVALRLGEFEAGNLAAWWVLNFDLTLDSSEGHHAGDLEPDLTLLPGWTAIDNETRDRIVVAAQEYVLSADPETGEWLGTNDIYRPAFAGYRALRLMLKADPNWVDALPADVWMKWAAIILAYPNLGGTRGSELDAHLLATAYARAPEAVIDALVTLIYQENAEHGNAFIVDRIEPFMDERLEQSLLDTVVNGHLMPDSLRRILSVLLRHSTQQVESLAQTLVCVPPPTADTDRARAVAAAQALLTHGGEQAWSTVWPAIECDAAFGREVVPSVADAWDMRRGTCEPDLAVQQSAELFTWLMQQYPPEADPQHDAVSAYGPVDHAVDLRNATLQRLRQTGSPEACDAISHIARKFPQYPWLGRVLEDARAITRLRTWVPPKLNEVAALLENPAPRLVRNGHELLAVLVDSLRRMEDMLQNETPAVEFLWERTGTGVYRPKDENSFSNWVKLHLDRDVRDRGIIVNREVEIQRSMGADSGERTDIHVDVAVPEHGGGQDLDTVSVIIEAKGCWNRNLDCAMETQLVNRYLKDKRCHHGLYLVGWFQCDRWDADDDRRKRSPNLSITDAQTKFDQQAATLSNESVQVKALVVNCSLR